MQLEVCYIFMELLLLLNVLLIHTRQPNSLVRMCAPG